MLPHPVVRTIVVYIVNCPALLKFLKVNKICMNEHKRLILFDKYIKVFFKIDVLKRERKVFEICSTRSTEK